MNNYLVYISKLCKKDIKSLGYEREIEKFRKKILKEQSAQQFDHFPKPFLKKRFQRQVRLISTEKVIDDYSVIIFLRLLIRGSGEYKSFGANKFEVLPGYDRVEAEITDEALLEFIEKEKPKLPKPPPSPSTEEMNYLNASLSGAQDFHQDHFCETQLWVDRIKENKFAPRVSHFIDPILETVDSDQPGLQKVVSDKNDKYGILYRRIPDQKRVILFAPFIGGDVPEQRVRELYEKLLDSEVDSDSVSRKTKRAYPHDLVLNDDAWFQIQKEDSGNMALSLEEIQVLESPGENHGGFPLFINGSAGSGKSTILQFLFSKFLLTYLSQSRSSGSSPVFFACNDELLEKSQESVTAILEAMLKCREEEDKIEEWNQIVGVSKSTPFLNFHSWLCKLSNEEKRFAQDKLVDYGKFKSWWEDSFKQEGPAARKLYNADTSWHVIRSYIKEYRLKNICPLKTM